MAKDRSDLVAKMRQRQSVDAKVARKLLGVPAAAAGVEPAQQQAQQQPAPPGVDVLPPAEMKEVQEPATSSTDPGTRAKYRSKLKKEVAYWFGIDQAAMLREPGELPDQLVERDGLVENLSAHAKEVQDELSGT